MNNVGLAVCKLPDGTLGYFDNPCDYLKASTIDEVKPLLAKIEESNLYAVGYVAYEAAAAFDTAFAVHAIDKPFAEFFLYDKVQEFTLTSIEENYQFEAIVPEINEDKYKSDLKQIMQWIYSGHIYQANYTFRAELPGHFTDCFKIFRQLLSSNFVPYPAFISFVDRSVISISPELFVQKNGEQIISAPMKGTASRKMDYQNDLLQKSFLSTDEKNCAENLMIVDMVRNDLGRFCDANSIYVDPLFHVDTYRTVHQMISLVHGKSKAKVSTIFQEMFPAASITGAPKIRAMEIIKELESSPRHIYCGAVGCVQPNGDLCFNVPIRTLTCEKNKTTLGIGSGVVADSVDKSEWQECLLKASFIHYSEPKFKILETLSWTLEGGYSDLDLHLKRLENSQRWFARKVVDWRQQLPAKFDQPQRLRLLVDENGKLTIENHPQCNFSWGKEQITCKISEKIVNSKNVFLYHKTTNRQLYQTELAQAKSEGFDEVIFFNERDELTEGCISNIFIKLNSKWLTPHCDCGLLAGIERSKLLEKLSATQCVINRAMFDAAEEVILCNSLRGSVKVCCKM